MIGLAQRRIVFLLLLLTPAFALGQMSNPKYKDYFLVGQFGEVCTMCEVIVLCQAGGEADVSEQSDSIPSEGDFVLYHLQTRTFWSQMSTIWEWFVRMFDDEQLASSGHTRPVFTYTVNEG